MASTTVRLAKEKGAKLYRESKFNESIQAYTIAIDNTDTNDNELHVYYRCDIFLVVEPSLASQSAHICVILTSYPHLKMPNNTPAVIDAPAIYRSQSIWRQEMMQNPAL